MFDTNLGIYVEVKLLIFFRQVRALPAGTESSVYSFSAVIHTYLLILTPTLSSSALHEKHQNSNCNNSKISSLNGSEQASFQVPLKLAKVEMFEVRLEVHSTLKGRRNCSNTWYIKGTGRGRSQSRTVRLRRSRYSCLSDVGWTPSVDKKRAS